MEGHTANKEPKHACLNLLHLLQPVMPEHGGGDPMNLLDRIQLGSEGTRIWTLTADSQDLAFLL